MTTGTVVVGATVVAVSATVVEDAEDTVDVGSGMVVVGADAFFDGYAAAGRSTGALTVVSSSADTMRRCLAENSGWHVVSVSVAMVGSVVATTHESDGPTICVPVTRYTNSRPNRSVTLISSPNSSSSS
ncbi:unannotated protein [freshwater metagenome]|uniref:Unannotated protein n=1 Tax=freshwater metagenome TaxID=449393 RepID=A0A6J6GI01_9ZZZZ